LYNRIQGKFSIDNFFSLTIHILLYNIGRPSTLSSLIKEAKQPEDGIRVASFAVMQAIADHVWGSQVKKKKKKKKI
jgi:hypothetical protein